MNILRVGLSLKLIDLDCAVIYREGATAGSKYSSAYIPPEMLWQRSDGSFAVRIGSSRVNHVPASPSLDMWALGCVLYLLCSGSTLFQCTVQDHISNQSDFEVLYRWSDDTKKKKLDLIENKLARNMVSMLLNKYPEKRLSASRLLQHPFFTGKSGARMMGDAATWDVFISYRVESDLDIASLIYDKLTACGLRVWWDKRCLLPGQNWETGFCSGLVDSSNLVCVLSRSGVKNPTKPWMNFEKLEKTSKCDNVLLEWRLALELKERGMLRGIFPVMVGDVMESGENSNYFTSGCKPSAPHVSLNELESKLREHLDREGLGYPYKDADTARSILDGILSNQGGFIEGDLSISVDQTCNRIREMVQSFTEVIKII